MSSYLLDTTLARGSGTLLPGGALSITDVLPVIQAIVKKL
jgi:hypothetical protein